MKYICFVPLIGGMAIANYQATGVKPVCVLSYEVFKKNESNLKNYWPDVDWHLLDEETNDVKDKAVYALFDNIDFVSSVCPCAGMSMLNTATRSSECETNNWLYKVAEFTMSKIKPKVYWGENAPGLYSEDNKSVLDKIRSIADANGYSFSIIKTDTALHGIPQRRVRTFFFCWKDSHCPILPWHKENNVPFNKYILDKNTGVQKDHYFYGGVPYEIYPEMQWILETRCDNDYAKYVQFFYDARKECNARTPYDYIVQKNLWDEYREWLSHHPRKDVTISSQGNRTPWYYVNYRYDKIKAGKGFFAMQPIVYEECCNAIISKNMNWTLHPTECRFLNTREIMAMMGMPDDYELISNNLQHVTQNVPVKTAKDMTEDVIKFLNGELVMTKSKFIKQNNISQTVDYTEISAVPLF